MGWFRHSIGPYHGNRGSRRVLSVEARRSKGVTRGMLERHRGRSRRRATLANGRGLAIARRRSGSRRRAAKEAASRAAMRETNGMTREKKKKNGKKKKKKKTESFSPGNALACPFSEKKFVK